MPAMSTNTLLNSNNWLTGETSTLTNPVTYASSPEDYPRVLPRPVSIWSNPKTSSSGHTLPKTTRRPGFRNKPSKWTTVSRNLGDDKNHRTATNPPSSGAAEVETTDPGSKDSPDKDQTDPSPHVTPMPWTQVPRFKKQLLKPINRSTANKEDASSAQSRATLPTTALTARHELKRPEQTRQQQNLQRRRTTSRAGEKHSQSRHSSCPTKPEMPLLKGF
jgi:hypothetical protein